MQNKGKKSFFTVLYKKRGWNDEDIGILLGKLSPKLEIYQDKDCQEKIILRGMHEKKDIIFKIGLHNFGLCIVKKNELPFDIDVEKEL